MSHKFNIGDVVNYRPASRLLREAEGIYSITGLFPEDGVEFRYRIKHFNEEHERVAEESELIAGLSPLRPR
jgi:hypothetical protein